MTALLYALTPETVHLAADSLSRDRAVPRFFVTKIFPLPHLEGVLCGTGLLNLILDWFNFIESQVVGRNILFLDQVAPQTLPNLAGKYALETNATTTIYHFGWSEDEGSFVGFTYRGNEGFKSQRLIHSIGIKPGDGGIEEYALKAIADDRLPVGFLKAMERMKSIDESKPKEEQVGIGGEVHYFTMVKGRYIFMTCHRFPDYEQAFQEMLRLLRREE